MKLNEKSVNKPNAKKLLNIVIHYKLLTMVHRNEDLMVYGLHYESYAFKHETRKCNIRHKYARVRLIKVYTSIQSRSSCADCMSSMTRSLLCRTWDSAVASQSCA